MPAIAFVNGRWSLLSSARVSVEDRGFQFGDGVYELIRTYGSGLFRSLDHLARLQESAQAIGLTVPYSSSQIARILQRGCDKAGFHNTKVYIQVTRGAAPRVHPFPKGTRPTFVATFRRLTPISQTVRRLGVALICVPDIRWDRCDIKSLNLLPNVLAKQQAVEAGAFEAIFVREGKVTEGSGSNLFAVFGKKVVTPPVNPTLLSGVTRNVVLELIAQTGNTPTEAPLTVSQLHKADEIFLTGTTIEILPVVSLDGKPIGRGRPGDTTQHLYHLFQAYARTV